MKQLLLLLFVLFIVSCNDDDLNLLTCYGNSEEQAWLENQIVEFQETDFEKYAYITRGYYQSEMVFVVKNCCPTCGSVVPVYDCSGNLLGLLGSGPDGIDPASISSERVVWASPDSVCNL